jgi:hypothetical protein
MNYLESKTITSLLSSPPEYKNPQLEEKLRENEDEDDTRLWLDGLHLTNDDMKIVAYYVLHNNKVSNVVPRTMVTVAETAKTIVCTFVLYSLRSYIAVN